MTLRRMLGKLLEIERGSTRSQSVENSLWKRLWTCLKADNVIIIIIIIIIIITTIIIMNINLLKPNVFFTYHQI